MYFCNINHLLEQIMKYFLTFLVALNASIAVFSQDPTIPLIKEYPTIQSSKETYVIVPSTNISLILKEEAFVDPYSPRITTEHFQSTFVQFYGDTINFILKNFSAENYKRAGYNVVGQKEVVIDGYKGRIIEFKIQGNMLVSQLYFGDSTFYVNCMTGIDNASQSTNKTVQEMYQSIKMLKRSIESARVFGYTCDTTLNFTLQSNKQASSTFRYNFKNQSSTEKNVSNVIVTQVPINGTTTMEDARDYIAKILSAYLDKTAEITEVLVDKSYSDGKDLIYEFVVICREGDKEVKNYVRVYTSDILDLLVWARGYNAAEQSEIEKFIASIKFK